MTTAKSDGSAIYTPPANKSLRRRCRCGICAPCVDDAKWERIFHEKFADLGYYSGLSVRRGSPLQAL